jgi:RHS repeat-associated protein
LGYDAESRNVSVTSLGSGNGSIVYDGDGRRVAKTWTPGGGVTVTTYYIYNDVTGQLVAEYSNNVRDTAGASYTFTDLLGSIRAVTGPQPTGGTASIIECYDYVPFGRMLGSDDGQRSTGCYPQNPDSQLISILPQKFTGNERDTEMGLDWFTARYLSSAEGRFMIPDPAGIAAVDPTNPQSWNMYSYANNSPLNLVDRTGLCPTGLASSSSGQTAAVEGEDCPQELLPPSLPPDRNCSGSECTPDVVKIAGFMGDALDILSKDCLYSSLREVLASGETPNEPNNGYGTVVKGQVIQASGQFSSLVGTTNAHIPNPSSLTQHPNILVRVNNSGLQSSAFGRYQINAGTAKDFDMTNFSPASQDIYADTLLIQRGASIAAENGNFKLAMARAGTRWASMPGSQYGQGGISLTAAAKTFIQAVNSCQ